MCFCGLVNGRSEAHPFFHSFIHTSCRYSTNSLAWFLSLIMSAGVLSGGVRILVVFGVLTLHDSSRDNGSYGNGQATRIQCIYTPASGKGTSFWLCFVFLGYHHHHQGLSCIGRSTAGLDLGWTRQQWRLVEGKESDRGHTGFACQT
ncbi:hypothetical protein M440DRAFT_274762 [Trichoderma longibrachiatum ATCC 18648]|uniref:Uncharacterized protein n=1 Tax=Trichoderma longibrachiatum ATCC 18648 TaxID=983965 RepID=A0A2T4C6M8_TRILO|nr:hypothetical protein M440DRAFT_274762 [Trichoderma longibrachiatum ATCC 18648]